MKNWFSISNGWLVAGAVRIRLEAVMVYFRHGSGVQIAYPGGSRQLDAKCGSAEDTIEKAADRLITALDEYFINRFGPDTR